MTKKGKFIVFEGINGCGKGLQIMKFVGYLFDNRNNLLFLTREPNNLDDNGNEARRILKSDGNPYDNQRKALISFSGNRITHNKVFEPLIQLGIDVISDRYYYSTFGFQHAQGLTYEEIAQANRHPGIRVPDITFLIDISVQEADKRLSIRDSGIRRKFDRDYGFMEKVRVNYLELPKILPDLLGDSSMVVIDGLGTPEEISERILSEYKSRFTI